MGMTNIVQLGPLVLAADRLLATALLLAFTFAIKRIGERTGRDTANASGLALVAGIAAARLVYMATHLEAYSQDWLSAFAIWQGGFNAWAGIVAAAIVLVARLGINRTSGFSVSALAVLALAWAGGTALLSAPPQNLPEMPVLATLDGGRVAPESLAGRPYVINLWATWCPPCRRELPMLAEVGADSEVPILLVSQAEPAAEVQRYLDQAGIPGDAVALDRDGALMRSIGGGALPTTLFINAQGQVVGTHLGEISRAALLDQIAQLEKD